MTTITINLDPTVLAHLVSGTDPLNISITMGDPPVTPTPTPSLPQGPLAPLMNAGLLQAGEVLGFHQRVANRRGRATVKADGRIVVEGESLPFTSPSKAAEAVTGNVINGWTLWHTQNGKGPTLDALRDQLRTMENEAE